MMRILISKSRSMSRIVEVESQVLRKIDLFDKVMIRIRIAKLNYASYLS